MRDPATGEQLSLPILYCDEHVVAVTKPAGLLVHRTHIARSDRIFALQIVRDQIGQSVYPVHRLDRPTSGVLLFGLSPQVGTILTDSFSGGRVKKTYLAVVRGWLEDEGTVDSPLGDMRDYTSSGLPGVPKEARSDYRCLSTIEVDRPVGRYQTARYSLGEIHPRTGKRHQVRRHMKRIGHPVIGDRRHGDRDHNRFFLERYGMDRLLLAAMELTFPHPYGGHDVRVWCKLDESLLHITHEFGWLDMIPAEWISDTK